MIINGCDIVTCGDMKCGKYKDCNKHIELADNEMCSYVWIPGLDCPARAERSGEGPGRSEEEGGVK